MRMFPHAVSKKRRFSSLTFTLAVAFVVLAVIVLLLASIVEIYFSIQTQEKYISEQQRIISNDAAKTVKSFVQEKFSILKTGASFSGTIHADGSQQKIIMEKLIGLESSFRQLIILDNQNNEVLRISRLSSFAKSQVLENIKSDLFLHVNLEGSYVSPVYIDDVTNEPMVLMAVPIKDPLGETKGVLVAETNLKFMWDVVANIKIGTSGFAYVVNKKGDLIAFADITRVLKGENLAYLNEVRHFVTDDEPAYENNAEVSTGIRGDSVVTTHARLGTPDWAVVVEMPVTEAYENVTNDILIIIAIIFVSIVVAAAGGIYLSKRITTPIISLRDAIEGIGKGKLNTNIKIRSDDEIGDLAISFNEMQYQLKKSRKDLERYTKNLERMVGHRTKDLDKKVDELENTKAALINMMEDSEETNVQLGSAKQELTKNLAKLKEIDLKKDEFISIAAHELKTPLTSIHGFSQLLLNESVAKDKQKRVKYLGIVESETKRLGNLVTEILDLSRVDLGTIKFVIEEVDINKEMENIQKEMNVQIRAKGLHAEYHVEKLPKAYTDRERLVQIMMNLINNSVKYTPKGRIIVKVSKENQYIHFTVKDTGIGIPKEHHAKIFQRFFQVDSSYTRKSGGTGLGLSLCKEFVNALGGDIWFKSVPGKGSEFHFTLPIKSKEVREKYGKTAGS